MEAPYTKDSGRQTVYIHTRRTRGEGHKTLDGVGSGFERIYGVHGTTDDCRFLWPRFAPKSSVDAFDLGKSAKRAEEEPNERKG